MTERVDQITTGVYSANDVEYLWDETPIDLDWENHISECRGECIHCQEAEYEHFKGIDKYEGKLVCPGEPDGDPTTYEPDEGNHDYCGPHEAGDSLFGSWIKKDGKYEPDPDGEFSAIYNSDYNTIQVVRSRYFIYCNLASPCYPGQGDVDSKGELKAYALPWDVMNETWLDLRGNDLVVDGKRMTKLRRSRLKRIQALGGRIVYIWKAPDGGIAFQRRSGVVSKVLHGTFDTMCSFHPEAKRLDSPPWECKNIRQYRDWEHEGIPDWALPPKGR